VGGVVFGSRPFYQEPIKQLYDEIPASFQLDWLAMLKKKPSANVSHTSK
jgi:hypothetical protein